MNPDKNQKPAIIDDEELDILDEDTSNAKINLIPVISISFVILVILMIISPILDIPNIMINLPEARTQESKERNITVSCSADGTIAVKTHIVKKEDFLKRFTYEFKHADKPLVIIRADQEVPYSEVEKIIRLVKQAGAERIAFGTNQK